MRERLEADQDTARQGGEQTVHPVSDAELGIRWWNGLTPEQRRYWLEIAGSARPVDAYEAFLVRRTQKWNRG